MKKLELDMKYFRGAVSPGMRMNKNLQAYYYKNELWKIRANCASSIQIAFVTDATELSIDMQFAESAREVFTCDVQVNNELTTFDGSGSHQLSMPEGGKNVIIHMPHLAVLSQFEVALNDSAAVSELPPPSRKLLLCGDSIMQGMTCTSPGRALGPLLAADLNYQLHNTSVGGAIMHPDQVKASLEIPCDVILVGLGINDSGAKTDLELFRSRTRSVLTMLNNFSGKAFIVTPLPCAVEAEKLRSVYSQIIREEQQKFPAVQLIEGCDILPLDTSLLCDNLHPNNRGMQVYAKNMAGVLRQAGC